MKMRFSGYAMMMLCALLPACADSGPDPEQVAYIARTKAQMIGMSRQEISTCLGQPASTAKEGGVETLSFGFGSCTAHLIIGPDNRVKSVDYSIPAPPPNADPTTMEEQCAKVPEVASCTRWLRN